MSGINISFLVSMVTCNKHSVYRTINLTVINIDLMQYINVCSNDYLTYKNIVQIVGGILQLSVYTHSSFPVIHKVDNVGISNENKL